jgi:hypothetical protein
LYVGFIRAEFCGGIRYAWHPLSGYTANSMRKLPEVMRQVESLLGHHLNSTLSVMSKAILRLQLIFAVVKSPYRDMAKIQQPWLHEQKRKFYIQ